MSSYTSKVIAVLGRTLRAGRWKLADDTLVIALFGRCFVDLTRAYVDEEDDDLTMSVFALFGSVSILLPAGCDVEPSGVAIVASSEIDIPSDRPADITKTALAPLDVSWFALFAKVRVAEVLPKVTSSSAIEADSAVVGGEAALDPPAVEVFGEPEQRSAVRADSPAPSIESESSTGSGTGTAPAVESFDDPDAEAATLRDEIAQWRAESARRAASDEATNDRLTLSPEDEIIDEDEGQSSSASAVSEGASTS